jgi:chaperone required for assembly of F1-ATPase
MANWAPKRFWKQASAEPADTGFAVRLDGRPVRTPARAPLVVPTLAMARAIAAEWDAQEGLIRPDTMPVTRAANTAIDTIAPQRAAVDAIVAAYGGTDLLCYRAATPPALVARQALAWDALIDWAATALGAPLTVVTGVMPVAQPDASLSRLTAHVTALSHFELAALHDLVALSGSLILGLAVIRGRLSADAAWAAARIDETWQIEQWGDDEEAAATAARRLAAFLDADRFYGLCR